MIRAVAMLSALTVGVSTAQAADYPTVQELEKGLKLQPGAQLPRDVAVNGKSLHVFYVGAVALGRGFYSVRLRIK